MSTAADLAGATDSEKAAARGALATYLQGLYPNLSLTNGPLADLVLGPAGDALAAVDHRATAVEESVDPETALAAGGYDATVLTAVLAGRGVTRISAAKASGTVVLVFTANSTVNVGSGFRLKTADGIYFTTTSQTRFLPTTGTAQYSYDVVLTADGTGKYYGAVTAAAEATGANGNKPAGTALLNVATLANLSSAYVATDMTGGADDESDADLLARLPSATASRTVASFDGAEGVVRAAVPGYSDVSTIGFGDAGMRRGRSVLSSQTPGRFDLVVRTADSPERKRVRVTATYVSTSSGHGVWQFSLSTTAAPGWFKVDKVIQTTATLAAVGYTPTSVTPGYDTSADDDPPDVRSAQDAFGTAYSTAVVRFTDTDTSISGLTLNVSTRSYDAVVRTVPDVDVAQAAVQAAAVKAAGGDCLVRVGCPVLVTVVGTVTTAAGVTVTTAEAAAAVAKAVNAQNVTSTLWGPTVLAVAQSYLQTGTSLQITSLSGTVYYTDGTTGSISGTNGLTVTTNWNKGAGDASVVYYADAESITITES